MTRLGMTAMRAAAIGLFCGARLAVAWSVINVDFQPGGEAGAYASTYSGPGALGDPAGAAWNAVTPALSNGRSESWGSMGDFADDPFVTGPLVDSAGQPTPVTLSIAKGSGGAIAYNPANNSYANIADDAKALMGDFLIAYGRTTNTVAINNLTPNAYYHLYLYGAGDNPDQETAFMVGHSMLATLGVEGGAHGLTARNDYVLFKKAQADGSGRITISYRAAGTSDDGDFNGLQLQSVPQSGGNPGSTP